MKNESEYKDKFVFKNGNIVKIELSDSPYWKYRIKYLRGRSLAGRKENHSDDGYIVKNVMCKYSVLFESKLGECILKRLEL